MATAPPRRLLPLAVTGLALLLGPGALAACGASDDVSTAADPTTTETTVADTTSTDPAPRDPAPSEPVPTDTSPPDPTDPPVPAAGLTATAAVEGDALVVTYRYENTTGAEVEVTAARAVAAGPGQAPDPASAYVTATAAGAVSVALTPFAVPPGVEVEVPAGIFATVVAPGEALDGRVTVLWPLVADSPYGGATVPDVPGEPARVAFCLGVGAVSGRGGEPVDAEGRTWSYVRMDESLATSTCTGGLATTA